MENIKIGTHGEHNVFFDIIHAPNKIATILGMTGTGKTTLGIAMTNEIVKQGSTVITFDIHDIFSEDQIYDPLRETFNKLSCSLDVYKEGIPMKLFTPAKFSDGDEEKTADLVDALTDALAKAFKLGVRQKGTLRQAAKDVAEIDTYSTKGIAAVNEALEELGTPKAYEVAERISQITSHNVFRYGESFVKSGKNNIIRLSKFSFDTQKVIVEVLLNFIWRMAVHGEFLKDGIFLFIDEFMNYDTGKNGILGQMLREGRKYNLNLILSTQIATQEQNLTKYLMMSGLNLFFQPSKSETATVARILDPGREDDWISVLRHLGIGEFIASGSVMMNGNVMKKPLKVSCKIEKQTMKTSILGGK